MRNSFAKYLLLGLALALAGCGGGYDDTALLERLEGLENRTALLEDRCQRINTNITALQGLVNVLESSDRIASIVPIVEEGVTVGYTFNFCYGSPVTVYCATDGRNGTDGHDGQNGTDGRNGTDGTVPTIGVQDVNGVLCWTLDGQLLTDGTNPIPLVTGGDTIVDGITPELKVEAGVWYYRLGSGEWIPFDVKAEYGDGNVFSAVSEDSESVVFTLSDGSSITIPKVVSLSLSVSPSGQQNIAPGASVTLSWTLSTSGTEAEVDAFAQGSWKASVQREEGALNGSLTVTAPADAEGSCTVVLFATGSDGLSVYEGIKFSVL